MRGAIATVLAAATILLMAPPASAQQEATLDQQVDALFAEGRYADVIPLAERQLAEREAAYGPLSEPVARAAMSLGFAELNVNDIAGSQAAYEKAAAAWRVQPNDGGNLGISIGFLAQFAENRGDAARAIALRREIRDRYTRRPEWGDAFLLQFEEGLASTLLRLGDAPQKQEGEQIYDAAIIRARAAFPAGSLQLANALERYGFQLFSATDRNDKALALLDEACPVQSVPADRFRCLGRRAQILSYLDRYAEAASVEREVIALAGAVHGATSEEAADAIYEHAKTLAALARGDEASRLLDNSARAIRPVDASRAARLDILASAVRSRSGTIADADEAPLRAALAQLETTPARYQSDRLLGSVALLEKLIQQGQTVEADALARKIEPDLKRINGAASEEYAALQTMIGTIAAQRGDETSAARAFAGAGGSGAELPGFYPKYLAAIGAFAGEDSEAAIPLFQSALTEFDRMAATNANPLLAGLRANVASLMAFALSDADRDDEAVPLMRDALARLPQGAADASQNRMLARLALGRVLYWAEESNDPAIAAYRSALADADQLGPSAAMTALLIRDELASVLEDDAASQPEALRLRAANLAYARQRRSRQALGLDAGADPVLRATARATADQRSGADPVAEAFGDYLQAAGRLRPLFPERELALVDEAFRAAQDMIATSAGAAMRATASRLALGTGAVADLARQQQQLAEAARQNEAALSAAIQQGGGPQLTALEAEARDIGTRLAALDARIDREAPSYRQLLTPRALSIAELRQRLRPGEAVLVIASKPNSLMEVFAISRDRYGWNSVANGPGVHSDPQALRCAIDPGGCGNGNSVAGAVPDAFDTALAYRLYQRMIAPVEEVLAGAKTVYLSANGVWGELPLGVLVTAQPRPQAFDNEAEWLADRHGFILLPSLSTLRALPAKNRASPTTGSSYLGYGDPLLSIPEEAEMASWQAPSHGLADPLKLRRMFAPLAAARGELLTVAQAVGAPQSAIVAGESASEAAIRADPRLSDARVIHLVTHGLLPDPVGADGGFSEPGLVFTPPSAPTPIDDGLLTASETATLNLDADWVILSACSTATGGTSAGVTSNPDSLGLLARAFFHAGARRLLASHWRLEEATGPLLTAGLLKRLAANPTLSPAAALQATQLSVREGIGQPDWNPAFRHPFYWAPLSIIAWSDDR